MFKKLIATMLILSIFTVQANASTHEGLKAAFNELNYSLTTEWDQKDKSFYETRMKEFSAVVRDLQSKGLTNAQLVDFAKSQMKDAKAAKDLETALTVIQINKMSSAEASKYVIETMNKSYSSGASWSGGVLVSLAAVVVLVVVLAAFSNGSVTVDNGCYYRDYYVCDTTCYNDYWYGYTCYDDCYYTSRCY